MAALHRTRRRVLAAGTAIAAALLAGCSGGSNHDPPEDEDPGPPDDAITDPDVEMLRASIDEPIVRHPDDETRLDMFFLTDPDDVSALEFEREPEGTAAVRSFLEDTDYDAETVAISQRPIGECYERRVDYLIADEDAFEIQFCRVLLPASVDCETRREEMQSTFIRIPVAYDEPPTDLSGGEGSTCRNADADGDAEVDA